MSYEIEKELEEVILAESKELRSILAGSEEHSRQIEDLTKLYKAYVDIKKIKQDKNQLKKQDIDMWLKYGVQLLVPTATGIFYLMVFKKGLVFEERGTIRSTVFRGFVNRVNPPKL